MIPIGFIGTGNMGEAIISGIIKAGLLPAESIVIFDISEQRTKKITSNLGVKVASSASTLADQAETIILAVKPNTIAAVLTEIKDNVHGKLIISIAAGITTETILNILGKDARVIRVMPNTPALVLEGASALARSAACTDTDFKTAQALFSSVGQTIEISEKLMDAVTALSGSGPAFCFIFMEALADGGVKAGLPRDLALKLAATTMKGSAQMVLEMNQHPGQLKDMVTSPSGTTIEGVSVLETKGMRSAVIEAVYAAYQRSIELGKSSDK